MAQLIPWYRRVRRLPASTLVEVTVAAAILVIVFGLAMASIVRLTRTGPNQTRLRARQLVAQTAAETIRSRIWLNRTIQRRGIELEQTIEPYPDQPKLLILRIKASADGRELAQFRQLVYAPPSSP